MKKTLLLIAIILSLFVGCSSNQANETLTKNENKIINESEQNSSYNKIDIGGGYYKDENFIFIKGEYSEFIKVNEADKNSFQPIGEHFGKDKNHIFYWNSVFDNGDYDSFEVLNNSYFSKDKNNAFYFDHIIPNVDIDTFEAINNTYAKDKNNIYQYYRHDNHIVESADVETFTIFNHKSSYAKDKNYVFYDGFPIKEIDVKSFELIDSGFGKDKNYVYCMNEGKTDFDRETFEVIGKGVYGKDKDGVYWIHSSCPKKKSEIIIKEADPKSFEEIFIHQEAFYAKYKKHVFLDTKIIENADPETFFVFDDFRYSKDKNHVFKSGILLENVDPKNFNTQEYMESKEDL